MADRGMGIRLFHSKDSLQQIFEEFEEEEDDENPSDTNVVTSQLRHFVIQVCPLASAGYDVDLALLRITFLTLSFSIPAKPQRR